ncbi:MAG: SGNH/GDSL hydrolase family protein [Clostridium sp.]|nr:SGNH/GDSL hydrolase family protein [Clostridium sp.]
MKNLKKNVSGLIRAIIFIIIFAFLFAELSYIFVPKGNDDATGMSINITEAYKAEDKNSIDVVFVGNSDIYRAINPVLIWEDNEITSCVIGMPSMTTADICGHLKAMFKKQTPKLVVLETDCMFSSINKFGDNGQLKKENKRNLIEEISYGLENLQTKFTNVDDALLSAISYRFPLMKYKERWKELNTYDFTNTNDRFKYFAKGYVYNDKARPFKHGSTYLGTNDASTESFDRNVEKDMEQIISICKEHNAQLVLLTVPSGNSWNWKKHNTVAAYAKTHNLIYTDYNVDMDLLDGFNWETDTKDAGNHLNNSGAVKVTKAYEKVLREEIGLSASALTPQQTEAWNMDAAKFYEKIDKKD